MTRNRPLVAAAAVLAGAFAVLLPAGPAQAHTELSSTSPAAKSTATKPLTQVTLTFSGLIKKAGTTVAVTGPDKVSYSAGAAGVLDKTITQPVNPLPVGAITVAWRTTASDGHVLQGSFTFTNQAAPPTPTTAPTPTQAPTPTAAATTAVPQTPVPAASSGDSSSSTGWWVLGGAVILVLALAGGLLWRRRQPPGPATGAGG
ncbi:copper resistance protein CopC [Micromonospora sp. CPCC 205371]|nr:copper resistance protein CopC [Micromonospora sp. CPCC 205371]